MARQEPARVHVHPARPHEAEPAHLRRAERELQRHLPRKPQHEPAPQSSARRRVQQAGEVGERVPVERAVQGVRQHAGAGVRESERGLEQNLAERRVRRSRSECRRSFQRVHVSRSLRYDHVGDRRKEDRKFSGEFMKCFSEILFSDRFRKKMLMYAKKII